MSDTKETIFNVEMSCSGCSNACTRILNKIEGVQSVNADLTAQIITVKHSADVDPQDMLAKLKKWAENAGKSVSIQE